MKIQYIVILFLVMLLGAQHVSAVLQTEQDQVQIQGFVPETLEQPMQINVDFHTSKQWYEYKSVDFTTEIENVSNISVTPAGYIEIYNPYGKNLRTIAINEINQTIEPGKAISLNNYIPIKSLTNLVGLGKYSAKLTLLHDGIKISKSLHFWIIPWRIGLLTLADMAVIISYVLFYKKHFRRTSPMKNAKL
jgi:hypothetical protein